MGCQQAARFQSVRVAQESSPRQLSFRRLGRLLAIRVVRLPSQRPYEQSVALGCGRLDGVRARGGRKRARGDEQEG